MLFAVNLSGYVKLVPQRVLETPVASLAKEQDQITAALDFLLQGY